MVGGITHQLLLVGYIYKVGLQTQNNGAAYGNTKLMFFTVHCMAKESYIDYDIEIKGK